MSCPCPVSGCDRNATEWMVCRSCAARLERDLRAITALAMEVTITLARLHATNPGHGAHGAETPLAFDPRASAALGSLKAILVAWVRDLVEHGQHPWPADSIPACARWLLARVAILRMHPAAGEICAEMAGAVKACRRVTDNPPELAFAGPCAVCERPLYAQDGAAGIVCTTAGCHATYDVGERKAYLLDAAKEELLTIPAMLRVLPQWIGRPLNDSTMRSWKRRGLLHARGVTPEGRDIYRIGDVVALIEGDPPTSGAA